MAGLAGHGKLSCTQLHAPRSTITQERPAQHNKRAWEFSRWPLTWFTTCFPGRRFWLEPEYSSTSGRRTHSVSDPNSQIQWPQRTEPQTLLIYRIFQFTFQCIPMSFKLCRTIEKSYYHPSVTVKGMEVQPGRGPPKNTQRVCPASHGESPSGVRHSTSREMRAFTPQDKSTPWLVKSPTLHFLSSP